MCICVYVYMCICVYVCMCVCVYIYIYIYIYILLRQRWNEAAWGCYFPPGLHPRDQAGGRFRADKKWTSGGTTLSNTTCLTHVFFKSGEQCSKRN